MANIIEIIEQLSDLLIIGAASDNDVLEAEKELGLQFAKEYKQYLYRFGAVLADEIELTGIAKSKNRNVINVTKREWEMNSLVSHELYVVENLGIEGIIIWQDVTGKIYQSTEEKTVECIADSLATYLQSKE